MVFLPEFEIAPMLIPKLIDKRVRLIWNRAGVHASDLFYYIITRKIGDELVLLGFFNSSIGALLTELYGRSYGGGVLDLKVYEVKQIPVLDPSKLDAHEKSRITLAFENLIKAMDERIKTEDRLGTMKSKSKKDKGLFEDEVQQELGKAIEKEQKCQQELDDVFYEIIDLKKGEKIQLEEGLKELQKLRKSRTQV